MSYSKSNWNFSDAYSIEVNYYGLNRKFKTQQNAIYCS